MHAHHMIGTFGQFVTVAIVIALVIIGQKPRKE